MTNTDPSLPSRKLTEEDYLVASRDRLGVFTYTSRRFSLTRPSFRNQGRFVADVLVAPEHRDRYLVVASELHDQGVYEKLRAAHVPVLDKVEDGEAPQQDLTVFSVPAGLSPLNLKALFSKESTATYISNQEILHRVGQVYGRTWAATGALPLDIAEDNPLAHIGIRSFVDSKDDEILFLCPPYITGETATAEQTAAREAFVGRVASSLEVQLDATPSAVHVGAALLIAASNGFLEGSS